MGKRRDPDRLDVKTSGDTVFIFWFYEEGSGGSMALSKEAASRLGLNLEAATLLMDMGESHE